jgi:hypothetical protein
LISDFSTEESTVDDHWAVVVSGIRDKGIIESNLCLLGKESIVG